MKKIFCPTQMIGVLVIYEEFRGYKVENLNQKNVRTEHVYIGG